ncbi:putative metalloprotease CJM1_0395 family protein [Thalassospira australica]|uniref:putative metalloprotease CJM1_0395 family protein n=1 Tax=Thalassospira australica TaxID=1528106 RepID=UPI00384E95DC
MTQAGAIQVIPGSGGQLGQVIAARALPGPGQQPATSGSAGNGLAVPPSRPAAVSIRPLGTGNAAETTTRPAATGPTALINSTASIVTIIQQLDPRSLPGTIPPETRNSAAQQRETREETPESARPPTSNPALLTHREREIVRELQARDANVRTEEESHQTLAGANAGMISYSYTAGPDGRLYATGGKVSIHPLQGLDGIAAIANQAAISRAASMPGTSSADFNVAQGASRNISAMIATQAIAAAESYRMSLGLGSATNHLDISG